MSILLLIIAISGGESSLTHGFFVRFPSARVRLVTHSASKHQQNLPQKSNYLPSVSHLKKPHPMSQNVKNMRRWNNCLFFTLRTMTYILQLVETFLSLSCEGASIGFKTKTFDQDNWPSPCCCWPAIAFPCQLTSFIAPDHSQANVVSAHCSTFTS